MASWYGPPYDKRRGANGEIYDQNALTAAHRTLPMNSLIKVTNLATGQSAIVRVTDRGPFVPNRTLDLSLASAKAIGVWRPGVARVRVDVYAAPSPLDRGGRWCVQIGAFKDERGANLSLIHIFRRPFFLLVSVAAIAFIMTLYRRLQPKQRALRWGLPLVLGGALGNVLDRIRYGHVIDFIDAHIVYKGIDHHWPTFNVADIAICVGVGLMAVDMFTSKRGRPPVLMAPVVPPAQSGEPVPNR